MPNNGWRYFKKSQQARSGLVQHLRQLLDSAMGVRPVADGTIPPELKQQDWGDGGVPNNTYSYNTPEVANYNNYVTSNDFSRNNTVFNSTTQITNVTIINPTLPPKVERKPSKLPVEKLGQTDTPTSDGKPIKIAKALEDKEYGRLIASPFSTKKIKLRRANDGVFEAKYEAAKESGLNKFLAYFLDEKTENLVDSICLVVPEFGRGFYGKLSLTFGADSLRLYSNYLGASSLNALMGVNDTIPKSYQVVNYNPPFSDEKIEIKDFVLDVNSENIRKLVLGDTDGVEINWENWIKAGVANQLDEDNDSLGIPVTDLAQLIRNVVANVYYRTGLDRYPVVAPTYLTTDDEEDTVYLKNQADFLAWQVKQLDALFGQFPIKIKVEDNDLIASGNQSLDISLPNLAETLAELWGTVLTVKGQTDAIMDSGIRSLIEAGGIKTVATQNYYLLSAISEYLGYANSLQQKEMPLTFDPSKAQQNIDDIPLSEFLQSSTVKIAVEGNKDKSTLAKELVLLSNAANIIKAAFWRKLPNDPQEGIDALKNIFRRGLDIYQNNDKEDDFKDFLEKVEEGWSDLPTNTNPDNKPYNKPYDHRPQIKRLSNNENVDPPTP